MIKSHLIFVILFILLSFSSCYTIHFIRTSKYPAPVEYEFTKWHHIFLLGLFEFSDPVDLRAMCSKRGSWYAVRVQTGFSQGLVKSSIGDIYSPEQVSVQCVYR